MSRRSLQYEGCRGGRELARLAGLVNEFLTYARPHDPALRPTAIHEIVERVAALLHAEAERKAVTLVFERPANLLDEGPGIPPEHGVAGVS